MLIHSKGGGTYLLGMLWYCIDGHFPYAPIYDELTYDYEVKLIYENWIKELWLCLESNSVVVESLC